MRKTLFLLAILLAASAASHQARASIIFSNLGVGNAYDVGNYTLVYHFVDIVRDDGSLGAVVSLPAYSFKATSTALLAEVDIPMHLFISGAVQVMVQLLSDSGSGVPGSPLATFTSSVTNPLVFDNEFNLVGPCCDLLTLLTPTGSPQVTLTADTTYWLAASVDPFSGPGNPVVWQSNTTGASGFQALFDGTSWTQSTSDGTPTGDTAFTLGAFELVGASEPGTGAPDPGTGVPEPGTGVMFLGAGALLLLCSGMLRGLRRRKV